MRAFTKKIERTIVDQFQSGISMELLAERMRVGIWQIESILRRALTRIGGEAMTSHSIAQTPLERARQKRAFAKRQHTLRVKAIVKQLEKKARTKEVNDEPI